LEHVCDEYYELGREWFVQAELSVQLLNLLGGELGITK